MNDILFGATINTLCEEFSLLMSKEFEMSTGGELTFFSIFNSNDARMEFLLIKENTLMNY